MSASQYHLSSQYYDICIRRGRNSCSVCYSPQIVGTAPAHSSFGLSAGSVIAIMTSAIGSSCTGVTTLNPAVASTAGSGDYLDIVFLQSTTIATVSLASATNRICGSFFNAIAPATAHGTACSYAVPFKVGVHFDADDNIAADADAAASGFTAPATAHLDKVENADDGVHGLGYSGFYLAYWQNTC